MDQNETQWDRLLKIKTTGRDDSHSDQYRYPYEPTQYCVLERLAHSGLIGMKHAVSGKRIIFEPVSAEDYPVPTEVDRCYFFNPFSVEILRKVLARIYESYYENQREILLFFYYPSEEYVSCLMTEEQLMFFDEIAKLMVNNAGKDFDIFSGMRRRM